jgi:hypothetical protein
MIWEFFQIILYGLGFLTVVAIQESAKYIEENNLDLESILAIGSLAILGAVAYNYADDPE